MNQASDGQSGDGAQPQTPWYKSVAFRMFLLVAAVVGLSWLLGAISRFLAPF